MGKQARIRACRRYGNLSPSMSLFTRLRVMFDLVTGKVRRHRERQAQKWENRMRRAVTREVVFAATVQS